MLALGAITNVASALLLAPDIADRIVVVWLGGHPPYWPDTREFNLRQDVIAAQVLFDSGAAVVQIPCALVAEQLRTTLPEMERYVRGQGVVGDYLYGIYRDYVSASYASSKGHLGYQHGGLCLEPGLDGERSPPVPGAACQMSPGGP